MVTCGAETRGFHMFCGGSTTWSCESESLKMQLSARVAVVVWTVLELAVRCAASVDLWVSKAETKALLGLATEIFYVQEGVINQYALNFTVIVPPTISELHFNWRRTTRKPVPYEALIEVGDTAVLDQPSLDIPRRGSVPRHHELITVRLPCRSGITAETDVRLRITLQLPPQAALRRKKSTAQLVFRRTRVCRAKVTPTLAPRSGDLMQEGMAGSTRVDVVEEESEEPASGVLYIAIGSACGVVLVIMIILAVVLSRNNAAKRRRRALRDLSEQCDTGNHYMQVPIPSFSCSSIQSSHQYATLRPLPTCPSYTSQKTVTTPLDPSFGHNDSLRSGGGPRETLGDTLHHSVSRDLNYSSTQSSGQSCSHSSVDSYGESYGYSCGDSCSRRSAGYASDSRVRDVGDCISELMVDRRRVDVGAVLEEGSFGRIASGSLADPEAREKERVIIKTVSESASSSHVSQLLQDGLVFYGLRHRNLLSVLGVTVEGRTPPLVLYPYVKHWNLKRYLQRCSFGSRSGVRTLTARDVVDLAEQLTQALLFLHLQNMCHADLAARNCCVDDSLHVRLSDGALSRDLFREDYFRLADATLRPVKWMAPEVLLDDQHTPASDVWSLGVLLWELTTLAQQPYVEVDPLQMAQFLENGYRLAKPLNCPDNLFSVMARCWYREPEERPTAEHILDYLHSLSRQLTHRL